MVYLLKMVIFHGNLLNNQRVFPKKKNGVPIRMVCPIGMGILPIDPRDDH